MGKKLTLEKAIQNLVDVHGDKYDYSQMIYNKNTDKVKIICKEHGEFFQRYNSHQKGQGCAKCGIKNRDYSFWHQTDNPRVYGVGFSPIKYSIKSEYGTNSFDYNTWLGMMTRAYNPKYKEGKPTYEDVKVCKEWLHADTFIDWCKQQIGYGSEDFNLDKDILIKGNKVYSPETCVFVPSELNSQFTKANSKRGLYPIGVSWHKDHNKFMACCRAYGKTQFLGYFLTSEDAFLSYKRFKENYLRILAEKYKNVIDPRCYEALYKYEVEITD